MVSMSDAAKAPILDLAQSLVQERGFNGFSYRDLSRVLGITTAGIHYHFPSKDDLGVAILQRYAGAINNALAEIAIAHTTLDTRLRAAGNLFLSLFSESNRVCVVGSLAGEYLALSPVLRTELGRLITAVEGWLERFLLEGRVRGELAAHKDPQALAKLWFSAIQGAILVGRASDSRHLETTLEQLLTMTLD